VDGGPDVEFVIHDTVTLEPSAFTDPGFDCDDCGTEENFTAVINCGEGPDEPMTVAEAPGSPGVLTSGTATAGSHVYRLPDLYTATVTVTDDDAGVGADTLTVDILGARDLKARAIDLIDDYADEPKSIGKEIGKAIGDIETSLDERYWVDDDVHLDPKHGHRVFSEEKQAYQHLARVVRGASKKGSTLGPAAVSDINEAIDLLVNADRVIAITQLLEAQALAPADPKTQKKVLHEVERAQQELLRGNAARAVGDFGKAIDRYKKAWEHALRAVEHAARHSKASR